jgi:hypothetical protein
MIKVDLPEMSKGEWTVKKFKVDSLDFSSLAFGRSTPPIGETFTKLLRGRTLVMSDTPAEQCDHYMAVRMAKGNCLINGLGIGMVLKNILLKPEVTSVTVVEISQDLIDLISPYYQDERVTYVCASAYDYQPPKGVRYDMVWHDIWDTICADNLEEMAKLHRKYGKRTDWQDSWCKYDCRRARVW